jgi:AraC family transcriptional regulator
VQDQYAARINRVVDYIESHLDGDLSLATLAEVACFSPYHFHRVFGAMSGEPLSKFVQRLRLERAACQLVANTARPVTEVALDAGFASSATFARAFRERFGVTAPDWRGGGYENSKLGKTLGNAGKAYEVSSSYPDRNTGNLRWRIEMSSEETGNAIEADVEVREIEEMHVAYVRHVGPYAGDAELFGRLWGRLMQWAGPRGLMRPPETRMLCVYHDDPGITDDERLRLSCCITVPEDTAAEGEIGRMSVGGGQYAVARFELRPDQFGDAWQAVFGGWLPRSGYQPADGPPFEWYHNDCREHPEQLSILDICVPVKPM